MPKPPTQLRPDGDVPLVAEVSGVPEGANERRFAFRKEKQTMNRAELYASIADGVDLPETVETALKGITDEDAREAVDAAIRLSLGYAESLKPEAVQKALTAAGLVPEPVTKAAGEDELDSGADLDNALAAALRGAIKARKLTRATLAAATGLEEYEVGEILKGKAEPTHDQVAAIAKAVELPSLANLVAKESTVPEPKNPAPAPAVPTSIFKANGEPDLSKVEDPIMRETLAEIWKGRQEAERASTEAAKQLAEVQKQLKSERDARVLKDIEAEVAEKYKAIPDLDPADTARTLKSLRESDPELAKKHEAMLERAAKAVTESGILDETTPSGRTSSEPAGTAYAEVEKEAEAVMKRVRKAGGEVITKSQAIEQVLTEKPELYEAYLREQGLV